MTMKLEVSDSQSMHSDYSCDSQSSQDSNNDYLSANPVSRSFAVPFHLASGDQDDSLMFATMFDYQTDDYNKPVLANLEGLQSGVPTRTTATITPTQLRSFDRTFIELSNCHSEQANHAGFVPPSVTNANHYGILNQGGYCESGPTTTLHVSPGPLSTSDNSSSSPGLPQPRRRNMGGRRPARPPQDISPEEEERRKVRRERNKQAAARCRKRRLDQTNELQDQTDVLEEKKKELQEQYHKYKREKERLETIINNHKCNVGNKSPPDVKPFQDSYGYPQLTEDGVRVKEEVMDTRTDPVLGLADEITYNANNKVMLSGANLSLISMDSSTNHVTLNTPPIYTNTRPSRPNTLRVPNIPPLQLNNKLMNNNQIAGVDITTPSSGMPFNYDSLMEGGTGLTPIHPQPHPCSHQQRGAPDVTSPDALKSLVSL